ncbi:MAG TPA: hypothetical protein VMD91_19190 [Candidatus Sulfotelmatobacter sp.]|nr:hypothetical protein [Candidatus Sulfotelmatobacter sp.]
MRVTPDAIYHSRGAFGVGFLVLGAVVIWRDVAAADPWRSKLLGGAFGVVLLGLGITRIVQYVRWRRAQRS